MSHFLKNILKCTLFFLFRTGSRFKVYILPSHYYSPISNIVDLDKTKHLWAKRSDLPGLCVDLIQQENSLKRICLPYKKEFKGNHAYKFAMNENFGPGYGYIEAQALHSVLRSFKPKRIVEVGCGVSTWCMLNALEMNQRETSEKYSLTCIEPHPSKGLKKNMQKLIQLIEKPVQMVPFSDGFEQLEANDFLFIDSSHSVKPGSDVNYIILEILPRLKPGVIVHFHDIYLPYDYPRDVLHTFFHGMETSLLRAFLTHNQKVNILFCLSHLHYDCQETMKEVFSEYRPQPDKDGLEDSSKKPFTNPMDQHFPSSIYFQIR